jgi:SAM-dependent methyltransferase
MTDDPAPDDVREFFDRQQTDNQYESLKYMTRQLDLEAALRLNSSVKGDVLSVGGIWDFFSWEDPLRSLTVLDLSAEMLRAYCPNDAVGVVGDFYDYEFPAASFDTIVFPLMLHHTPQGNWRSCESRVERALERAQRLLRKDGTIFILEYCPHPVLASAQRILLPFTRWFLAKFRQPLVVMYPREFYAKVLSERFGSSEARRVDPTGFNYWKWYPIFMSIRWLRMPLALYPKLHLITAPSTAIPAR